MSVRAGDVALIFLAGFGASQGVLESMRTDSITVSGLAFVRVLQITALICLVLPAVVFGIRAVKRNGVNPLQIALWLACAGLLALAIYMEFTMSADYSVQLANYSAMANCMIGIQVIIACMYLSQLGSGNNEAGEETVYADRASPSRNLWEN